MPFVNVFFYYLATFEHKTIMYFIMLFIALFCDARIKGRHFILSPRFKRVRTLTQAVNYCYCYVSTFLKSLIVFKCLIGHRYYTVGALYYDSNG